MASSANDMWGFRAKEWQSALHYRRTALADVPGLDKGWRVKVETGRPVRKILVNQVRDDGNLDKGESSGDGITCWAHFDDTRANRISSWTRYVIWKDKPREIRKSSLQLTLTEVRKIALYSIGPCFFHQSHPQLDIVFALAPSRHLSGVISPLISSSILGTYQPGEFLFQYSIILPSHTVHGVLKARIVKWLAIPSSSGPHSVRPLHHDPTVLGGPTRHGLFSLS